MTDDNLEALLRLCDRSWQQFNERRKYEIQVTFGFWTVLVLAIAALLRETKFPQLPCKFAPGLVVFVVAILIIYLHYRWCMGVLRANYRDRQKAIEYQEEINAKIGFHYSSHLRGEFDKSPTISRWGDWNFQFQVGVTVFLASVLFLVFIYRLSFSL